MLIFVFTGYIWLDCGQAAVESSDLLCTGCHKDLQRRKFVHETSEERHCDLCHEATAKHLEDGNPTEVKTDRSAEKCFHCHESQRKGMYMHPGLLIRQECVLCHDPHGSNIEKLLKEPLNRICFECHDPVPADVDKGSDHSVVKDEKSCMNCHHPHSSEQDSLLISHLTTLCQSCHDREIAVEEQGRTRKIKNIKQRVMEMQYAHNPTKWCTACHASHGSRYRSLLVSYYPKENYNKYKSGAETNRNTFELCFSCHNQAMLNENITAADTGFRNDIIRDGIVVRQNLHWFHVVDAAGSADKSRGRSCNICHDPHGSDNPHLIRSTWVMRNFDLAIIFENRPNGGECLRSCHTPKQYQRIN